MFRKHKTFEFLAQHDLRAPHFLPVLKQAVLRNGATRAQVDKSALRFLKSKFSEDTEALMTTDIGSGGPKLANDLVVVTPLLPPCHIMRQVGSVETK